MIARWYLAIAAAAASAGGALIALQLDDAKKPITLYINIPGGSIVDGMAIYDCIRRSTAPRFNTKAPAASHCPSGMA